MKVKITKPDSIIFDGEAKMLQMPGSDGLFEMLDHHAPIISALRAGAIKVVEPDGKTTLFDIRGGVVKGEHNIVTILAQ